MKKLNPNVEFLLTSSDGLNLRDPEDRAVFRIHLSYRLKAVRCDCLREWTGTKSTDRATIVREIADHIIDYVNAE